MITKISNLVVGKKNPKHEISKNTERKKHPHERYHMQPKNCSGVKYVPLELIFYEIGSTETYVTDFYEICSRME